MTDHIQRMSAFMTQQAGQQDDNAWRGRQQTADDNLDQALIQRLAALFGHAPPPPGAALPPLWHWAFFQTPSFESELGEDGHPEDDDFLPPRNGRQRMWAGGEFEFRRPLMLGLPARRVSTLENIEQKQGRSGALTFLTVRHDYYQEHHQGDTQRDDPAISERQDIVYRAPAPPKTSGGDSPPEAQWQRRVTPTPVLLFRYSAVTFNGHRIHYDQPYATGREGYSGLVVHGPMIATLMLDAFQTAHPEARLRRFTYRGQMPLTVPEPFTVAGRIEADGQASLWAANDRGVAHQATLEFEP
ncbi:itaconyl-CoA hydratase [Phytohalomonas tamaricis]|uniref:itaconyl-CoA hydratase n=1 Tax=Phytohalomonas tamaricis TaxID=2081032 RepID=UPI0021D41AE7|nr:itaconyl-CoA hydratase [Phytohalomonas tamaricis]